MLFNYVMRARRLMVPVVAAMAGVLTAPTVQAAYPDKPVRIEVGFVAGGTTDVIARIIAKELTLSLGQSFVVENKPGASSNIAAEYVARARPDGYTLLFMAVTSTINQTLFKKLNFDIVKDFTPVALGAKMPNILVVNPQVPVNSVQELVEYAKKNPGKLAYGSSGSGTSIHMAGELFKQSAGIDVLHVPYKGSSQSITALIGGQVQYMFDNMVSSWPYVQSGRMRALAVTTAERSPTAPDVPTMKEAGFNQFDVSSWFGLLAPAGTPPEVVQKLNETIQTALAKPEVQQSLQQMGGQTVKMTPAEFGQFLQSEVEHWAPVVKASGASVD